MPSLRIGFCANFLDLRNLTLLILWVNLVIYAHVFISHIYKKAYLYYNLKINSKIYIEWNFL